MEHCLILLNQFETSWIEIFPINRLISFYGVSSKAVYMEQNIALQALNDAIIAEIRNLLMEFYRRACQ